MVDITGSPRALGRSRALGLLVLVALLLFSGCRPEPAATGPFPALAEYQGQEIREVAFSGDLRFSEDSLRAVVRTRPTHCQLLFLPICLPFTNIGRDEQRLDLRVLAQDVTRVQLYHRDHGYYGTQVAPRVEPLTEDRVAVEFVVAPGRQVMLRDLTIEGAEEILPAEELLEAVPLREGEPFGRLDFLASADTIRSWLLQRGHAYADVLRNYAVDTIAGVAEAHLVAIPGPVVVVDTLLFQGNERLAERTLRRQVTFREGEVLEAVELNRSQRNLYALGMVNFASVRLAPDTLQLDPDLARATVLVQVVEAAQYGVEASAGFGTVDCFRTGGRWVNRNFLGGGRRLEANAAVSRIGVGDPVDLGLDGSICSALGEEGFLGLEGFDIRDRLNYRLSANFQQPRLFATQNQLGVNLHAERQSELDAYMREAVGGQVAVVRELERGPTVLSTTFDIERGRTLASPVLLCVGFDTCTQEDLERLRQRRWSNSLSLSAVRDGQRGEGAVLTGFVLRGGVDWASPVFGSDDQYLRVVAEGSRYDRIAPGWVFATNLRAGRFLQGILGPEDGYIPPERRFYAGGPTSVRGYARNALGPTAYVIQPAFADLPGDTVISPTGGTQVLVASAELRMPSPWFSDMMRLAAFVDAGHVSAPGATLVARGPLRFTPGVGGRFMTPVGPFRLDLAYNPYAREPGPLYLLEPRAGLLLIDSAYRPEPPTFWGRLRLQFALGHAF